MTLYVGNIDFKVTSEDLADIFSDFGKVVSAKVIIDKDTNRSKGFAFVEMGSSQEGRNAISNLNGAMVEGRSLKVNEARPKVSNGNGGGFNKKY